MMRVGLEYEMSPLTIKISMKLYYMDFRLIDFYLLMNMCYDYTLLHIIYDLTFDCIYMFQIYPPKRVRHD